MGKEFFYLLSMSLQMSGTFLLAYMGFTKRVKDIAEEIMGFTLSGKDIDSIPRASSVASDIARVPGTFAD